MAASVSGLISAVSFQIRQIVEHVRQTVLWQRIDELVNIFTDSRNGLFLDHTTHSSVPVLRNSSKESSHYSWSKCRPTNSVEDDQAYWIAPVSGSRYHVSPKGLLTFHSQETGFPIPQPVFVVGKIRRNGFPSSPVLSKISP